MEDKYEYVVTVAGDVKCKYMPPLDNQTDLCVTQIQIDEYLVQTNTMTGLTDIDVIKAKNILGQT